MNEILKNILTENNVFEAKAAKNKLPDSMWDTYCAFANTDGGVIILGLSEDNNHTLSVSGIDNPEKMVKEFWDCINNKEIVSANLLTDKCVEILKVEGKSLIKITVPRAERYNRPVFRGKNMVTGTYRRNGEGDYRCTEEEVSAMFRDAGIASMDSKIIREVSLSDFSKETIRQYRQRFMLVHPSHVWNNLSDEDFLRKIGATKIDTQNGNVYPTVAGLLMFGTETEILYEFSQYFLDYQEHFDDTVRWSDRFVSSSGEWSGNLFDFFFKTVDKLTADIKRPFSLKGIVRTDDTPVHKAIREILLNTIVNSDYYGRCGIVVKKYKDKLVFENPGLFRISMKEALNGGISDPRNPIIMKMFSLIDIGERAGSGIPDVISIWKNSYGCEPYYEQKLNPDKTITVMEMSENSTTEESAITTEESAITTEETTEESAITTEETTEESAITTEETTEESVITTEETTEESVITTEEKIIGLLQKDPKITARKIAENLGITEDGVFWHLDKMKKSNRIRRVGATKNGQWEVLKK